MAGEASDAAIGILVQLGTETRDDVKDLISSVAGLERRVAALESRPPIIPAVVPAAPPTLARDATLAGGVGTIIVAVLTALQALGWVPAAKADAPRPAPVTASPSH